MFINFDGDTAQNNDIWVLSDSGAVQAETWQHVCAVFSAQNKTVEFYINGLSVNVNVSRQPGPAPVTYLPDGGNPMSIGRSGSRGESTALFAGIMDELRISGTSRSADWIKLIYENQRENSSMLEFKQ
jgi:hypothetical protein